MPWLYQITVPVYARFLALLLPGLLAAALFGAPALAITAKEKR